MRKMISRILVVVIVASAVCMAAVLIMTSNINSIIRQYEDELQVYFENRKDILLLGQEMYNLETLLWTEIINNGDESVYEENEANINTSQENIKYLLNKLNAELTDSAGKEQLHQISKNYGTFTDHITIVISLSREKALASATYYINTNLIPHLKTARSTLVAMSDSISEKCGVVQSAMDNSIIMIKITKIICITIIAVILFSCIVLVVVNSRRILNHEENEKKSHQQKIMNLQYMTIVSMANLIENRDGETGEHVKRTGNLVQMITDALGKDSKYSSTIDARFKENMWKAAPLHDIGKIKIPDAILTKPGKLTDEEFDIMKKHAAEGGDIVEGTIGEIEEQDYLDMAHDVARYHHERWDGTGYPDGLKGEEIPLCARIMAVADVFDALVSERCYKKPMSVDRAYEIITEESGSHFDPEVVEAFVRIRPLIEQAFADGMGETVG